MPAAPITNDEIRTVFLKSGFTVKDGHDDLKPYVFDAARRLLALAATRGVGDSLFEHSLTYEAGFADGQRNPTPPGPMLPDDPDDDWQQGYACGWNRCRDASERALAEGLATVIATAARSQSSGDARARERLLESIRRAALRVGPWLSAALDDEAVCQEMKADVMAWMDATSWIHDVPPEALASSPVMLASPMVDGEGSEP